MNRFDFLRFEPRVRQLLIEAESRLHDDPNASIVKVRQACERITASLADEHDVSHSTTANRQEALKDRGLVPISVIDDLTHCRRLGNDAVHRQLEEPGLARQALSRCYSVATWYAVRQGEEDPGPYVPPSPTTASFDEAVAMLREESVRIEGRLPFHGFASRAGMQDRPVDELFVAPGFKEGDSWGSVIEAIAGVRLLVNGGPGTGKTTALKQLLVTLARDDEAPVPLFFPLNSYEHDLLADLHRRVRRHLMIPIGEAGILKLLREGRVVLLMDGLDECRHPARALEAIRSLSSRYPEVGVVLTSRPAALTELDGFRTLTLRPWTSFEAVFALSDLLGKERAEQVLGRIYSGQLAGLLEIPLLVALLGLILVERGELPDSRRQLLDAATRTLLETWPNKRGVAFTDLPIQAQIERVQDLCFALLEPAFDGRFESLVDAVGCGIVGERFVEYLIYEAGLVIQAGTDQYRVVHDSIRDHHALRSLVRNKRDVVRFTVQQLPDYNRRELLVELVLSAKSEPGLAGVLIEALSAAPLPGPGAWYGASRGWWVDWFVRVVEAGLPLDQGATDRLLRFEAEDRLRIFSAADQLEPMVVGDEDTTTMALRLPDSFGVVSRMGVYGEQLERVLEPEAVLDWLRSRLRSDEGEDLRATVCLAMDWMSEDEISALVGNRAATLLFLWPRSMAGRFRKRDGARRQDEAWPGLQLSTRAAIVADVEQAINQVKQGSDWFSRVAAAIASGAGQGLLEGLIWLVTRQALSLGLPDHWSPARLPPLLEVGPLHRCVRLTPSLGMRPRPGTSGPLERFRGAVRLGWIDPELLKVLLNSDLRTPTSLVRFSEPWPDVSDLDALDVSELVGRVDGTELVGRLGKLRPTYVLLDAEGKVVDIPQDSVPLQLAVDGLPREEGTDAGKDRRSVLAAELVAASLVTRGLEPNDRLLHFQHRLQCRATFELWPLVEQLAARHPERDYSTIFAALLWAQQVWTGMRPASPAVAQFLVSKPYSWLGRTFWALFRLANPSWDQSSPAHDRKVLKRALREGGTHPVAQLLRSHKRPNGGR